MSHPNDWVCIICSQNFSDSHERHELDRQEYLCERCYEECTHHSRDKQMCLDCGKDLSEHLMDEAEFISGI